LISWIICKITLPIFGIGRYYQRFVTACVLFCNSNSLPIAIVSSVAVSEAGKTLYWLPEDDQNTVSARGISYTLFFGLFCNLLRWSVGYNLLQQKTDSRRSSETTIEEVETGSKLPADETTSLLNKPDKKPQPNKVVDLLTKLAKYMSPPLYAALLALFVGLCPPLKKILFSHNSFVYNSFTNAIKTCGKASVPLVLFCLGAQLHGMRSSTSTTATKNRLPISLAVFLRMIVTPMIVLPVVYLFGKYGSRWSDLANDPMFLLSIIVVGCTPTSINLSQITQVSGAFEEEMLNVLFWSYGAVCIPVCTIVVFLALYLINSL
jgi:predicted permease